VLLGWVDPQNGFQTILVNHCCCRCVHQSSFSARSPPPRHALCRNALPAGGHRPSRRAGLHRLHRPTGGGAASWSPPGLPRSFPCLLICGAVMDATPPGQARARHSPCPRALPPRSRSPRPPKFPRLQRPQHMAGGPSPQSRVSFSLQHWVSHSPLCLSILNCSLISFILVAIWFLFPPKLDIPLGCFIFAVCENRPGGGGQPSDGLPPTAMQEHTAAPTATGHRRLGHMPTADRWATPPATSLMAAGFVAGVLGCPRFV